jgi:hypothetical protein
MGRGALIADCSPSAWVREGLRKRPRWRASGVVSSPPHGGRIDGSRPKVPARSSAARHFELGDRAPRPGCAWPHPAETGRPPPAASGTRQSSRVRAIPIAPLCASERAGPTEPAIDPAAAFRAGVIFVVVLVDVVVKIGNLVRIDVVLRCHWNVAHPWVSCHFFNSARSMNVARRCVPATLTRFVGSLPPLSVTARRMMFSGP